MRAVHDDTDDGTEGGTQSVDSDAGRDDDVPGGFDRWRNQSALGAMGTGIARGLQAVFAPPVDEPVIVAEAPGEPPGADDRIRVILHPDDPTKSVAIVPERSEPDDPPG